MANILIVDDSWLTRRALIGILAPHGFDFQEAQNGNEALTLLSANAYDCVILDLLMPEMTGIDVLARMKEKNITAPVIILTADIQDTTREKCLELGAFDFVNKPPREDRLYSSVQKAVQHSKGQ